jgi:Cd2+/Zn2+-exporting ATPase/Cu+-exporting ATPase
MMAEAEHEPTAEPARSALFWADAARIALVGGTAAAVRLGWLDRLVDARVAGLLATGIGGWPILREALESALRRRMTMELSMTIAIAAGFAIGEPFTALVITLFVLVAEVLEHLTVSRGRRAIQDLLSFLPRTARVRREGRFRDVPLADIRVGEHVLVTPGARVPVDGTVVAGHSYVEEATITGEPMPAEKRRDSVVYAGTMNQTGALEVRADRLGRDTSFGKIVDAVERAERTRAPVQRLADRLAGHIVCFALAAAVLTLLLTRDARSTIAVVIVAGACGVAAGTPLAILGAIGQAARHGAIVKGGVHLETLAKVDTVVLDKTGTLTFGTPRVCDVHARAGGTVGEVIAAAAVTELRSEHPLGKAVLAQATEMGLASREPEGFQSAPGGGVVAWLGGEEYVVGSRALLRERGSDPDVIPKTAGETSSEVLVSRGGRLLGSIQIVDQLRPEAPQAIAALRSMGLRTVLLTGDRRPIAEVIARQLRVDEVDAELLPEAKVDRLRDLLARGRIVAMVGDGVNDAPALVEASVGVAMGCGADVAQESADVVLLGNDLLKLVEALRVARRTRVIILQNFVGTLVVDGIGILLATMGLLQPLLAAFIHVASELAFILNSARLLPAPMAVAGPRTSNLGVAELAETTVR